MEYTFGIIYTFGYCFTNCEKVFNKFKKALSKEQRKTASYYQGEAKTGPGIIQFLQK